MNANKYIIKNPILGFLLRWRWLVISLSVIILVIFEFSEHPDFLMGEEQAFFIEVGIFILFAIVTGVLLELLWKADLKLRQTLEILSKRHELSLIFSSAKSMDELSELILESIREIVPATCLNILMFDDQDKEYLTINKWSADPSLEIDNEICPQCIIRQTTSRNPLLLCDITYRWGDQDYLCYNLTLAYGNQLAGVIRMGMPVNRTITPEQSQLLGNIAGDMAFALSTTRQERDRYLVEVANATNAERLAIARDLHDSLGQNLGFVHLKLDQILSNDIQVNPAFVEVLEQLRSLANESYELVRNTLVVLHKHDQHSLHGLFRARAQVIADRAGFDLCIEENGTPSSLTARHLNELFFVIKEVMHNIEKHAQANQVQVGLYWQPDLLMIQVSDDGKGFDQQIEYSEGHYGLNIMKDRIESLEGKFDIESVLDQGTKVSIEIPLI